MDQRRSEDLQLPRQSGSPRGRERGDCPPGQHVPHPAGLGLRRKGREFKEESSFFLKFSPWFPLSQMALCPKCPQRVKRSSADPALCHDRCLLCWPVATSPTSPPVPGCGLLPWTPSCPTSWTRRTMISEVGVGQETRAQRLPAAHTESRRPQKSRRRFRTRQESLKAERNVEIRSEVLPFI